MKSVLVSSVLMSALLTSAARGDSGSDPCDRLPGHTRLHTLLRQVVLATGTPNGGFGNPMWLTVVDGSGSVCAVTNSLAGGDVTTDIFIGSRVVSAQKGEQRECLQLRRLDAVDCEPVLRDSAGRQPVRPGRQQSGKPGDRVPGQRGGVRDVERSNDRSAHRRRQLNLHGVHRLDMVDTIVPFELTQLKAV